MTNRTVGRQDDGPTECLNGIPPERCAVRFEREHFFAKNPLSHFRGQRQSEDAISGDSMRHPRLRSAPKLLPRPKALFEKLEVETNAVSKTGNE